MTDEFEKPRRPKAPRGDKPFKAPGAPFKAKDGGKAPRPRAKREEDEGSGERIAKRLARAGIASRREAEALITDGRVRVNGTVLSSPAFNVESGDRIELDGREIPAPERTRLFLFHKPAGVVTTNRDPEGRRTVFDALPEGLPRVMTVGRLDINTEGLLLLTNDGGLARVLELPSTGWLRRYRVRVHGDVDENRLKELAQGISVEGVFYGAIEAELERTQGSNSWLTIGLREGKNREVKNVMGALGLEVTRLIRVSYGPFQLGELEEGHVQEMKGRTLRDQLGDRLIEEAGADFEAEVRKPFSNRPTARGQEPPEARERDRMEPGEGGLIKNRKRERERLREDALSRLDTRPERRPFGNKGFGGKPAGGRDRNERPTPPPPRDRTSNVWMAPGARPQGKNKLAEATGEGSHRPARREGEGFAGRRERPEGRAGGGEGFRTRAPREGGDHPHRPRREEGGEARRFENRERPEGRVRERSAEGGDRLRPREDNERPRFSKPEGRSNFGAAREGNREEGPYRPREGEGPRPSTARPPRREGVEAKRPYRPRPENGAEERRFEGGQRDARGGAEGQQAFRPPRREGEAGEGRRPFGKGPRPEGGRPFAKGPRKDGAPRSASNGPKPAGGPRPFKGPSKAPFKAKPGGGDRPRPAGPRGKRPFRPRSDG